MIHDLFTVMLSVCFNMPLGPTAIPVRLYNLILQFSFLACPFLAMLFAFASVLLHVIAVIYLSAYHIFRTSTIAVEQEIFKFYYRRRLTYELSSSNPSSGLMFSVWDRFNDARLFVKRHLFSASKFFQNRFVYTKQSYCCYLTSDEVTSAIVDHNVQSDPSSLSKL